MAEASPGQGPARPDLLAGSRGRRLCFEVLSRHRSAQFPRAHPLWWQVTSGRPDDPLSELVQAVSEADLREIAAQVDPAAWLGPLAVACDVAVPWQEPDEVDTALADPLYAEMLRPIADALLVSPATAWWAEPLDREQQWAVRPLPDDNPERELPRGRMRARDALARWRESVEAEEARAARERPADPRAAWSGIWWSAPHDSDLVVTTPAVPGLGVPAGLFLEEDSLGGQAAEVRPVRVPDGARVLEIRGAEHWSALVARYALPVTSSRRHDWFRSTGRAGAWAIPDWAAVARDWDAVHLTVAGYLEAAGRAIDVLTRPGLGSALMGWAPGMTWWLTDVEQGPPVRWVNPRLQEDLSAWVPE